LTLGDSSAEDPAVAAEVSLLFVVILFQYVDTKWSLCRALNQLIVEGARLILNFQVVLAKIFGDRHFR
jgi:hypothetical protein